MFATTRFACDTPFVSVEVFLETAAECRLTDAEIGERLHVGLAGVPVG